MPQLKQRKLNRFKDHGYALNGYYFVTICSKNREDIFGQYKRPVGAALVPARNNIQLSIIGQIIDNQLNNLSNQYDNVVLDQYIIMPNHIHGILIIQNNDICKRARTSGAPTLSTIIRSFKSKSSMAYLNHLKQNNEYKPVNIWQRSFYDHIIRTNNSLDAIRQYIANNPENWENDIENILNP